MKAAIYVRVSTADQHVESQLYDLRELAAQRGFEVVQEYGTAGSQGEERDVPVWTRSSRMRGGRNFSVVLSRRIRPSRAKRQAFPASHGRVRQISAWFYLTSREHRHQRSDGTTLLDAHWLNCRTRIGLDPRARFGWHAKSEARRGANRTRTNEHRSSSHCPRPTRRDEPDGRGQEVGHFPQSSLQVGKEITGW